MAAMGRADGPVRAVTAKTLAISRGQLGLEADAVQGSFSRAATRD